MKKTLIALAALAVVSAASAQSTVSIYGSIDMSVTNNKDTNSTTTAQGGINSNSEAVKNQVKGGALTSNRLGFKGTEDLGGGLKANFVYELDIAPDEKTPTLTTRLGTVGVSGNFGAVTLGRQYTPYHIIQAAMDLYGNNNAPGYVVALHNRQRASNSVQYSTPSIAGFSGIAQVGAGEATNGGTESVVGGTPAADTANGKNYGLAGVYAAGPLVAGFAYDSVTKPAFASNGFAPSTGSSSNYLLGGFGALATRGASDEVKTWAVGASYDFTVVKASLAYSSLTDTKSGSEDLTSKGYNLSVAAPFGPVTVLANIGRADLVTTGVDGTYTGYQLGANYSLSKRTTAYVLYGADKLTAATANTFDGEFKRTQASVGVRHSF